MARRGGGGRSGLTAAAQRVGEALVAAINRPRTAYAASFESQIGPLLEWTYGRDWPEAYKRFKRAQNAEMPEILAGFPRVDENRFGDRVTVYFSPGPEWVEPDVEGMWVPDEQTIWIRSKAGARRRNLMLARKLPRVFGHELTHAVMNAPDTYAGIPRREWRKRVHQVTVPLGGGRQWQEPISKEPSEFDAYLSQLRHAFRSYTNPDLLVTMAALMNVVRGETPDNLYARLMSVRPRPNARGEGGMTPEQWRKVLAQRLGMILGLLPVAVAWGAMSGAKGEDEV